MIFFCAYFWYTAVLLTYNTTYNPIVQCAAILHVCCHMFLIAAVAKRYPSHLDKTYPLAMSRPSLQFLCIMKDI